MTFLSFKFGGQFLNSYLSSKDCLLIPGACFEKGSILHYVLLDKFWCQCIGTHLAIVAVMTFAHEVCNGCIVANCYHIIS